MAYELDVNVTFNLNEKNINKIYKHQISNSSAQIMYLLDDRFGKWLNVINGQLCIIIGFREKNTVHLRQPLAVIPVSLTDKNKKYSVEISYTENDMYNMNVSETWANICITDTWILDVTINYPKDGVYRDFKGSILEEGDLVYFHQKQLRMGIINKLLYSHAIIKPIITGDTFEIKYSNILKYGT